jgi:sec-independent protein translocase protein TatC
MDEARARGEMPFLDHLEELRWRILWSLAAVIGGTLIGFLVVQHFDVLALLKRPIAPFLPAGKLYITRPTDAFIITLKLAVLVGVVLAAPIVIWQVWAFFSPALYARERRFVVPALFAGLVLFVVGALIAYQWVLPGALRILFSFQRADLESIITADEYFGFAAQLVLAFGVMFELPLVIVLLAAFGLVNPKFFARNRPFALVVAAILAAFLSPGPDAFSMLMLLAPILVLYEAGIFVGRIVWRARQKDAKIGAVAGLLLLLAVATPGGLHAQRPPRPPRADSTRVVAQDSLRARAGPGQGLDTAAARLLGLPTAPTRSFPEADSIIRALLADTAYQVVRYAADSVILFADSQAVALVGQGLVEQEGATLEADTVRFRQARCELLARGDPTLFQKGSVLVGHHMRYDTCERRGFVDEALTSFNQSGVDWLLRAGSPGGPGGLSVDSGSVRLFAGGGDLTSCELPIPDYHFHAGSVKWVNNTILIARPTVLYVRDVPILWLPFIFQDMRPGRRSGMLVPRFGVNDLVRPNQGYARHVTNIGYYFALSDYVDFQASMDWYAGTSVAVNGQFRYRWLDQFLQGGLALTRLWEEGTDSIPGGRSLRLQWRHDQAFNLRTHLAAQVDYVTSARVVERNTVDPYLATASLGSNLNFSKTLSWGTLSLGGSLRQDLTNGAVNQTLPSFTLSPMPLDIGRFATWSPSFTLTVSRAYHQYAGTINVPAILGAAGLPVDSVFFQNRTADVQFSTPIRIGGWNWQNSVAVHDEMREGRDTVVSVDPTDPSDTTITFYGLSFQTTLDWNTGFGLPTLFPATWKLQPSIGIQNRTGGPFMLRNRYTNGAFVVQGKRLSFGASLSPSFFGFFPGFGPIARIRHKLSPVIRWTYAPAANVPEEYARAVVGPGRTPQLRSPTQHRISFGLTQNFEGKLRPAPGDTSTDPANARKVKLLGIQTSDISYDFEQAKAEGRTGWVTQSLSNQFTSDLLPGFSFGISHDLWEGPVGTDSAKFAPFLSHVSARFSISERTVSSIVGLITGRGPTPSAEAERPEPLDTAVTPSLIPGPSGDRFQDYDQRPTRGAGKRPFSLSVTYDNQRQRPTGAESPTRSALTNNETLGMAFGFDPTKNWSLSWSTQYNLTTQQFGQHVVRLERDLHRWRATFQFLKSPNGNFAFNFFISLLDQPEIKMQYDQQTLAQPQ